MAVNANKPDTPWASAFSERLAQHSRVAYYRYPDQLCDLVIPMVIDEILVGFDTDSATDVATALHDEGARKAGTVFSDHNGPHVEIWRLESTPGLGPHPDVAQAVWAVLAKLTQNGIAHAPGQIAPNHVLVPANFHSCPSGPPGEHDRPPGGDDAIRATDVGEWVSVAVIDSGYLGASPIDGRVDARYGHWFTAVREASGEFKGTWLEEADTSRPGLDRLDQNGDQMLDALVGHADFVAGVIAQASGNARITVVSHNGAFVDADDAELPIPTEASVARSLWEERDKAVINVGFAFPTLPTQPLKDEESPVDSSGPPSWSFAQVLGTLAVDSHVVVAPAGNQSCPTRQYPAAFGENPNYPNVVGVASLSGDGTKSDFTNYGPWVTCCTEGEDVVSTFIFGWDGGPTEEKEPLNKPNAGERPSKSFDSGWASWNGTSFAAPKVAGEIASLMDTGKSPLVALNELKASSPAAIPDLGIPMRGLRPL